MEFFRITDSIQIQNRNILNITRVQDQYESKEKNNSSYIISINSTLRSRSFKLKGAFCACLNEEYIIEGNALIIDCPGYLFNEQKIAKLDFTSPGQLSYIDGCSNTNVIDPLRNGDPCLNYLYFPPSIQQTFHTHPSLRIGVIVHGQGTAEIYDKKYTLKENDMFILERHVLHRFLTENSSMSLFVFHPDSEDGPRDEFNPMKTRTYLK